MATERFVTPTRYIAGTTTAATLELRFRDVNGKRRVVRVRNVGSYRLREDGSLFSVRTADKAGVKNALSLRFHGKTGATIRHGQGNELTVSDVSLTLSEAGRPVLFG